MGRKRKDFSDKFKIEVAKEALKKRSKEAEVAAKYNIAPSTLSEWMELFLEGKLETDGQKALREENEKLRAKQEEMLASLGKKPCVFVENWKYPGSNRKSKFSNL